MFFIKTLAFTIFFRGHTCMLLENFNEILIVVITAMHCYISKSIVGVWKLVLDEGYEICDGEKEEWKETYGDDESVIVTFNADGTGTYNLENSLYAGTFTWEEVEGAVVFANITSSNESAAPTLEFAYDDFSSSCFVNVAVPFPVIVFVIMLPESSVAS